PVCAIVGDGAFGFNVMELETAVREKLPVVVIVAVDDAWGMEKTAFAAQGFGPGEWAGRGIDMGAVRYDGIAQMMGCHGELVRTQEELRPALERATAAGKPAVLHVQVDRDLNTTPPGYEQFRKARNTTVY
ncbi:MAG TPA: thiamine pyrophosphate-dependent enzyme, partial [Candidatus Binatia bacterium]|nr:thiamine pyrophosphate-dependent enzyme [Candidatus Binatia bacterium]